MTDRYDPLETSAQIIYGYRRYLRSLLPVRDSRVATALAYQITHSDAAHEGAAARSHPALRARRDTRHADPGRCAKPGSQGTRQRRVSVY